MSRKLVDLKTKRLNDLNLKQKAINEALENVETIEGQLAEIKSTLKSELRAVFKEQKKLLKE